MDYVFIVSEYAGMGTGFKTIAVYQSEDLAKQHLDTIKLLAPETGSKFEIKSFPVKQSVL